MRPNAKTRTELSRRRRRAFGPGTHHGGTRQSGAQRGGGRSRRGGSGGGSSGGSSGGSGGDSGRDGEEGWAPGVGGGDALPAGTISAHVRHGDKGLEMRVGYGAGERSLTFRSCFARVCAACRGLAARAALGAVFAVFDRLLTSIDWFTARSSGQSFNPPPTATPIPTANGQQVVRFDDFMRAAESLLENIESADSTNSIDSNESGSGGGSGGSGGTGSGGSSGTDGGSNDTGVGGGAGFGGGGVAAARLRRAVFVSTEDPAVVSAASPHATPTARTRRHTRTRAP